MQDNKHHEDIFTTIFWIEQQTFIIFCQNQNLTFELWLMTDEGIQSGN